jgi:hypothetical protein
MKAFDLRSGVDPFVRIGRDPGTFGGFMNLEAPSNTVFASPRASRSRPAASPHAWDFDVEYRCGTVTSTTRVAAE